MPINSNRKGKAGERELAKLLTDYGFPARRGQQFSGSPDSPDVISEIFPFHIECKRTESLSIYKAMEQAKNDAGKKPPCVFHRRNGGEWLAILRADDFLTVLQILDLSPEITTLKTARGSKGPFTRAVVSKSKLPSVRKALEGEDDE